MSTEHLPTAPRTAEAPADHRSEIVVAAGAVTTLVALAGVFAASHHGENIMGWYANYIIPAGALLVGMVAASGYGVAAWFTGLKMSRKLMWSVCGQLALSYFIAQYEEYHNMFHGNPPMGFFAWFDEMARGFAFKQSGGGVGDAMGVFGYFFRLLEIAGFVGGGLLVPVILGSKPYCDPCRTYKRTKQVALFVGGAEKKTFGKVNAEENDAAWQRGVAAVRDLFAAAAGGDRASFESTIASHGPISGRAGNKLTGRVAVSLVRCPRCADGALSAQLVQQNGNNVKFTPMGQQPLSGETVRALFD